MLIGGGILYMSLVWLDIWTGHGKYEIVPSMRGLHYTQAVTALEAAGLHPEISDSIYDDTASPGTVIEQSPRPNTKVKPNRTVYLTVTAFSPKMVTLPAVTDMSLRQARSMLEGIGLKNIREHYVPSEYRDLVLGVKFNGIPLSPGARIPVSAVLVIDVGEGISSDTDSIEAARALYADSVGSEIEIE